MAYAADHAHRGDAKGSVGEGTPRALLPVTERVLAWVASERRHTRVLGSPTPEDLRAIELCALATREACFFHDLYGGIPRTGHIDHRGGDPYGEEWNAPAPQVCVQRRAPGRVPPPEGGCGCSCSG